MRVLILIAIIAALVGCRKYKPEFDGIHCSGNCYIFTGKVADTPSNAALQGAEVKFYYRPSGYAIFFDPTVYLGHTTTDASGEYKFQFDGTKYKTRAGYYRIEATKNGYFYETLNQGNTTLIFDLDSSQFNIPITKNFILFSPAKLSVRLRATTITNFQFLLFTYNYGGSPSTFLIDGGHAIDTTMNFQTAGDVKTFIEWSTYGNGVNVKRNDTLFTTRGGTINYQINL